MKRFVLLCGMLVLFSSASLLATWTEFSRDTSDSKITLSTVTARVREIIDDPNSPDGTVRYSSATIYGLINTAQRTIAINTHALTAWATQQLTADTTEYLLPANCLAVTRVTVDKDADGTEEYIEQTTVMHLDKDSGKEWNVDDSSQTPTNYYLRNRYIGVYPVPNNSGAILKIWYVKLPALMSAESTYVFDGYTPLEAHYEALAAFAAAQILFQEGNNTLAGIYSSYFSGTIDVIKSWINYRPDLDIQMTAPDHFRP